MFSMRSRTGIFRPRCCMPAMMSSRLTRARVPLNGTLTATVPSSERSK
jgi:hypothetical protein